MLTIGSSDHRSGSRALVRTPNAVGLPRRIARRSGLNVRRAPPSGPGPRVPAIAAALRQVGPRRPRRQPVTRARIGVRTYQPATGAHGGVRRAAQHRAISRVVNAGDAQLRRVGNAVRADRSTSSRDGLVPRCATRSPVQTSMTPALGRGTASAARSGDSAAPCRKVGRRQCLRGGLEPLPRHPSAFSPLRDQVISPTVGRFDGEFSCASRNHLIS